MRAQNSTRQLHDTISAACNGLLNDFKRLRGLFVEPHSEMDGSAIAANLMEFGRGQISGIDHPSKEDTAFIEQYVQSISIEGELAFQFCVYVSGCVLGWVLCGELSRDDLSAALEIVRSRAEELFPDGNSS